MSETNKIENITPVYPLRVAAELTGTSVYTLRQYVDLGLIIPFKTESNRRLYSQTDIQRIRCIRKYIDEYGLNIAGIKAMFAQVPCWLIRPCSKEDQKNCDAFTNSHLPCWLVKTKGEICENEECRTCNVYQLPNQCVDIKSIFKVLENSNQISEKKS
ncbi:MAG: MerR family transcriptional regulator [Candidatus Marinimicrobia bacterium]|nr:MerR family transcriptional regulator [Candidatus Neomarinimicrobiota bacterium]